MASLEENASDTNCTEPTHVAHEQEQGEEPELATDTEKKKKEIRERCQCIKKDGKQCRQSGRPTQSGGPIINGFCSYHRPNEVKNHTALVPAKQAVLSDTDADTEDETEDEHEDDAKDEKKFEKSSALLPRRSRAPRAVAVDPLDMIGREVEQTFPKFGSGVWRGTVRAFSVACLRVCLYLCTFFRAIIVVSLCVCRIGYVLSRTSVSGPLTVCLTEQIPLGYWHQCIAC